MGKLIILVGLFICILGALIHFAPWTVSWFGRLPGDIRYESEGTFIFIPWVSMLLISVLVTLVANLFSRS